MKILFFTDVHLWNRAPSNKRIGNYTEDILLKIEEIVRLINKHDCAIFGGDFFETQKVYDFTLLSRVVQLLRKLEKNVYYIWGQHDVKGYNAQSRKASTFYFISKFIPKLIELKKAVVIDGIRIIPYHVWDELRPIRRQYDIEIAVAHKLIVPEKHPYECIWIGDLNIGVDVLLSGDYHGTFVERCNGIIYANPGSIGRRRITEKHFPSCLSITVRNSLVEAKRVKLKSAKKYVEIYEKEAKEKKLEVDNGILAEFVKSVREFEMEASDIFDLVLMVAKDKKVDEKVLDLIVSKR